VCLSDLQKKLCHLFSIVEQERLYVAGAPTVFLLEDDLIWQIIAFSLAVCPNLKNKATILFLKWRISFWLIKYCQFSNTGN
jgi:hypothetical protein